MALPTIEGGFADVEESSFELLPKGTYLLQVYSGEIKESGEDSKHPGTDYINWELNVQDEGYENRKLWYITSLFGATEAEREEDPEGAKKTLGMLKGFLKAVGYTDEDLAAEDFSVDIDDITGRYVRAEVYIKKDKNDQYPDKNQIRRLFLAETDEDELP